MLTILGIPNCDQVKKARRFLERHGRAFTFRDVRRQPLSQSEWRDLLDQDGQRKLINTRAPSFRKTGVAPGDLNPSTALQLLTSDPTIMKRPVLLRGRTLVSIGFSVTGAEKWLERPPASN